VPLFTSIDDIVNRTRMTGMISKSPDLDALVDNLGKEWMPRAEDVLRRNGMTGKLEKYQRQYVIIQFYAAEASRVDALETATGTAVGNAVSA
jgi:hypothetical protein